MNKILPYLVAVPLVALALLPPNSYWVWLVLVSAFFSFVLWFFDINIVIKLLVSYVFINCFFSSIPYFSFTAFIILTAGAYFYLLCTKIKNWDVVFKAVVGILLVNAALMAMQFFLKDRLLNFGMGGNTCYGMITNGMQFKSYIILLLAFLLLYTKPRISGWFIFWIIAFAIFYWFHHAAPNFKTIRWAAWIETLAVYAKHPIVGWGIDTYKVIFPTFGKGVFVSEGRWETAHNEFLQIFFELGPIGFTLFTSLIIQQFFKSKEWYYKIAFFLVVYTLMVHFPIRQIQTVLILIIILAYTQKEVA